MRQKAYTSSWFAKHQKREIRDHYRSNSSFRRRVREKKVEILGCHSQLLLWVGIDWHYERGLHNTVHTTTARRDLVKLGNWLSRKLNTHLYLHGFYSQDGDTRDQHSHCHLIVQANIPHISNEELLNSLREGWTNKKYDYHGAPDTRVSKGRVWGEPYELANIDNNLEYCFAGHDDLDLKLFCGQKSCGKRCRIRNR